MGKELEFSVWVGYCGGHDSNTILDFCQLGIEVFWVKAGEPTGDPRRRKPMVSLAGRGGPRTSMSFGLVEYCKIVSVMEVASVGLRWKRSGIGEWPEVEIRMCVTLG